MNVTIIETSGLGDRSYLISDGEVAVAVDPQRDIDRVLELTGDLRITHVLETHIHSDYVTGGLALAKATGAQYVVPAGEDVNFDRHAVEDGDRIDTGGIHLEALLTPGHTHHHVSYVLREDSGDTVGVFTGGSLLFGSTGRTDLVGDDHTEKLARLQYHSVRRLADELPSETAIYPTHGFGSFCSATPPDGDASTIGEQRLSNPALTQDEQEYVDELLAGLAAYPAYYAHMGVINRAGPEAADLRPPKPVDAEELRQRIDDGEWVVDLRNRTAFAAGHLRGTYGFELSGSFVNYLGWLYSWGAPLTLIGADPQQVADAQRELARIGIDRLTGSATGDIRALADGATLGSYRVASFKDLVDALDAGGVTVVDVRQSHEFGNGHVRDAVNIALHELPERLGELAEDRELWIHCASGYRASIAAALLDRHQRRVVLIDDDYDNAEKLNITQVHSD
ncbi:MBL fold metallo-hydrolase [Mycobacterium colombiense]|uniref:MBL fold metallo-hydrolase n=1 Tax=Mycobacterium colombiense TaxID=339268 RepID=A0A853LYJ2_9MYCO|nr:MBL fold metallo-hydrolase [Mycobacterium colombiense]OBJ16455.1 MBL fold metallo-hydrolase [Mycobacterium colombiense]OBJ22633.1 MBL fold metallo-hydrolase [Mycobacterium colombiense]OBJ58954.1 MBL fold metallo-hydrolase [Mycobacterium colombiense]OBK57234.1 MBL fold metallo-hydrolase [Mycobacterium colombiense]